MTHRFPLPTDVETEKLITQVYESLPYPDQSRLSLIESKLLQKTRKNKDQKKLNKIPWWIVLLLAGSFATAAWWAGGHFVGSQKPEDDVNSFAQDNNAIEGQAEIRKSESDTNNMNPDNKPHEDRESPVIYRRESF